MALCPTILSGSISPSSVYLDRFLWGEVPLLLLTVRNADPVCLGGMEPFGWVRITTIAPSGQSASLDWSIFGSLEFSALEPLLQAGIEITPGTYSISVLFFGDEGRFANSGPANFSATIIQRMVDVVWQDVAPQAAQVYVNWNEMITGRLVDVNGLPVTYCGGYPLPVPLTFARKAPGQDFMAFSPGHTCDSDGNFVVAPFNAGDIPGIWTVRIMFAGDASHNPSSYDVTYEVIPGTIVRNTYFIGYPNPSGGLVLPGQAVQLGVGIYVGDYQNCPPGCSSLPPFADIIPGTVQVKVYITPPNTGGGSILYKTVNITNGEFWFESYITGSAVGTWHVTYVFSGNAEYNPRQMTLEWDVGECNEDIYETCPDGNPIMTYQCVNGTKVATGIVCPTLPTTMACDSGNYNGLGPLGKVGDKFYFHAAITGTVYGTPNQPIGGIPINVFVRKPSDSNLTTLTTLVTGNDGGIRADYYPMLVGTYYFRFEFNGGMVNGIARGPSSCDVSFDIVPCYSGEVLETRTCPDGSVIDILTCADNQPYETGNFCPGTECRTAHPSMECQNGNEWDCAQNVWVDIEQPCGECLTAHPTGHACIDGKLWVCLHGQMVGGILPPPVWTNTGIDCCDQDQVMLCDDGSTVVLKRCIDNVLYPTGLSCHGPTPNNDMLLILVGGLAIAGAGVAVWMLRKPRAK